jgi:CheY-like chemotaxis protein
VDGTARPGLSILLVDDHHDTLRAMSRLLRTLDHRVTTADSKGAALAAAAREPFDVVISDIGLPDGTGLELMRELLAERPVKGIALTGYGTDSDIADTRAAGFAAHLTKPIDFQALAAEIRRLVG